jgi:D-alanyl-D-alanine carboxypeptidase
MASLGRGLQLVELHGRGAKAVHPARISRWRRGIALVAAASIALSVIALSVTSPAAAGPALLVEQATGRVLYAEEPDQSWYPASLTKLMTAYVVFGAVKAGRIKLDTPVPLSEKARGQPATRIGLKAGIPLNVEQAVRGLLLRSANDFAMALAELVGESEEGFAVMMNDAARRLGMTRTHFKNPHGLPDPEQQTTARDMAILALALHRDFPENAEFFSTMQFGIHRGTFYSQNDLLRTLEGADGMKTGFTCGAGYNIVASATREGRRMIAVVLGEERREERSQRAAALLEHAFAVADWKTVLGAPTLARLTMDPAEVARPVHDMTRLTRTRKCGNRVRRARPVVARGGAKPDEPAASVAAPVSSGGDVVVTGPPASTISPVQTAPSRSAAGGLAN